MPWEWQPRLKALAESLGMDCFSSPFDPTAVDFLMAMDVPAFKVASFELVDLPLVRRMAATGRPLIMSTGMATEAEIDEAVAAARSAGATEIALLKCTSAYPSPPESVNLRAIPAMAERWGLPVGLSDHTLGDVVAIGAVAHGRVHRREALQAGRATTPPRTRRSRSIPRRSGGWSTQIRVAEAALGLPVIGPTDAGAGEPAVPALAVRRRGRRRGRDRLTEANVRSIRPADGLHTRHYEEVLGRRAAHAIARGTPLSWDLLEPLADVVRHVAARCALERPVRSSRSAAEPPVRR